MNKQGEMKVAGANETVMEIFEVTGFNDILNIVWRYVHAVLWTVSRRERSSLTI